MLPNSEPIESAQPSSEVANPSTNLKYAASFLLLLVLSIGSILFLAYKNIQSKNKIDTLQAEVMALQSTTTSQLPVEQQPEVAENSQSSTTAKQELSYIRICKSPWSFQSTTPLSKECLKFYVAGAVTREVYNDLYVATEEKIELTNEQMTSLNQLLNNSYKLFMSDSALNSMSKISRIPSTGGANYVEISSTISNQNPTSLLTTELVNTYDLSTFYPESGDSVGESILSTVESLLQYDQKYLENKQ